MYSSFNIDFVSFTLLVISIVNHVDILSLFCEYKRNDHCNAIIFLISINSIRSNCFPVF